MSNLISIAARKGGDPEINFQLRLAIDKAREANMPKDNIERAIKRGTGEGGGGPIEELVYEGIGPAQSQFIIRVLTDSRNRAAATIRHIFSKYGGSLGAVMWNFELKGVLMISKEVWLETKLDWDEFLLEGLEAGVEDGLVEDEWMAEMNEVPVEQRTAFVKESLRPKHMMHIFGAHFFPSEVKSIKTPDFHIEMLEELAKPDSSAIIEPRGHAKTTWLRIDVLHDIVYEHEPFLGFISSSANDAYTSIAYVKAQLESNELLRSTYGNLVPPFDPRRRRRWRDNHIETVNRVEGKDGVVLISRGAGKGRGMNIKGRRPTKLLLDDIEGDEQVRSEVRRQKMEHWLFNVIIPSLDPERGRFKMVGTVLHYQCLVLQILKKYGGIRRAAMESDGKPSLDGDPLWPEVWTKQKLLKKRDDMGTFAFSQEYLNEPMSDENADVKLAWIRRRTGGLDLYDGQQRALWSVHSGLDPAISMKQTADETAIVTVARQKNTPDNALKIVVASAVHGKWNMSGITSQAKRVFDRYPHEKFICEAVAFQEGLRQVLNANGVPARASIPKGDKRSRLQRIVGHIEFGRIEFMEGTEDLITQLVQFPNTDEDDLVDAFVMAVESALGTSGGFMMEML
jgi:predicted phage terminase large subunit-like protein